MSHFRPPNLMPFYQVQYLQPGQSNPYGYPGFYPQFGNGGQNIPAMWGNQMGQIVPGYGMQMQVPVVPPSESSGQQHRGSKKEKKEGKKHKKRIRSESSSSSRGSKRRRKDRKEKDRKEKGKDKQRKEKGKEKPRKDKIHGKVESSQPRDPLMIAAKSGSPIVAPKEGQPVKMDAVPAVPVKISSSPPPQKFGDASGSTVEPLSPSSPLKSSLSTSTSQSPRFSNIVVSSPSPKTGSKSPMVDVESIRAALDKEKAKLQQFVEAAKAEADARSSPKTTSPSSNPHGYLDVGDGYCFGDRYVVQGSCLGTGAFSSVYKCRQLAAPYEIVAIKVLRDNKETRKVGDHEVKLMATIAQRADRDGNPHFTRMHCSFTHGEHFCMVFELMDCNLRGLLKKNRGGFPVREVRMLAKQLFRALAMLDDLDLIHGDVKLDNILMDQTRKMIKICDLGSAKELSNPIETSEFGPRFYRAPEVIVGSAYDTRIDVWSAACTVYELATGDILFQGEDNNGMLSAFQSVLGPMPPLMVATGKFAAEHFNSAGEFVRKINGRQTPVPPSSMKVTTTVSQMLAAKMQRPHPSATPSQLLTFQKDSELLRSFVSMCLELDPTKRMTAYQALRHPFLLL